MIDWEKGEERMRNIVRNGNDGLHYEHPLESYIHEAPHWATRVHQPAGGMNVYAQNEDGRCFMMAMPAMSQANDVTLALPPLRWLRCVANAGVEGSLALAAVYVTRSPVGNTVMVRDDNGVLVSVWSRLFEEVVK